MSYFLTVGPKSARKGEYELFNPEINSTVENLYLKDVFVNGEGASEYIRQIEFDDIYNDGTATGKGVIKNIKYGV